MSTLLSGEAVLPKAQRTDIYLTALGMLLTCVYLCGLIFRPRRQIARMGIDSLAVLVIYAVGIADYSRSLRAKEKLPNECATKAGLVSGIAKSVARVPRSL